MDFPPREVKKVVNEIAEILRSRNETLSISEAACGGLISAYLVSVPGASDFYIGGKLLYSLKQRLKLSGWSDSDIRSYMGPSEQVALKLARTTKYELGSTYVLSETGFAGPTAELHLSVASNNEQIGKVYLGISGPKGDISSSEFTQSDERSYNMAEFARRGLLFLLSVLRKVDAPNETQA